MAHKARVGGTNYGIKGGKCRVSGTNYSVKKGRTRVSGTNYNIKFATPLGIIGNQSVGTSVFLPTTSGLTEFIIIHQGLPAMKYNNTRDYVERTANYPSNCSGTWLLSKYVDKTSKYSNTAGSTSFDESNTYSYFNNTLLNKFDSFIQSTIKEITLPLYWKPDTSGYPTTTLMQSCNAKIFSLAYMEVGQQYYTPLDYFVGASDSMRIAYTSASNNTAQHWQLRDTSGSSYVRVVTSAGKANGTGDITGAYYTRPALVLPSTAMLDTSYTVIDA